MALFKKKKETKELPTLDNVVQKKLSLFLTIVNEGQAKAIIRIFERFGSSAQFVQRGEGTATKEIYDLLGLENNGKDIIFSFVSQDKIDDVKKGIGAYFIASRRNSGISMAIPLSSIIGVRIYQFLANTVED